MLAADACDAAGLSVPEFDDETQPLDTQDRRTERRRQQPGRSGSGGDAEAFRTSAPCRSALAAHRWRRGHPRPGRDRDLLLMSLRAISRFDTGTVPLVFVHLGDSSPCRTRDRENAGPRLRVPRTRGPCAWAVSPAIRTGRRGPPARAELLRPRHRRCACHRRDPSRRATRRAAGCLPPRCVALLRAFGIRCVDERLPCPRMPRSRLRMHLGSQWC